MKTSELHYRLTNEEWLKISDDLNRAELKVLFHLRTLDPFGDRNLDLKVVDIAEATNLQKGTVSKALKVLSAKEYINDDEGRWKFQLYQCDKPEQRVRDRLLAELGGLKEVTTPAGRIDLLTETEVIEVKWLSDWKSALGQVMAYSGFYPKHQKRIHLFSDKPISVDSIPHILETCVTLGVLVSFEKIPAVVEVRNV